MVRHGVDRARAVFVLLRAKNESQKRAFDVAGGKKRCGRWQ